MRKAALIKITCCWEGPLETLSCQPWACGTGYGSHPLCPLVEWRAPSLDAPICTPLPIHATTPSFAHALLCAVLFTRSHEPPTHVTAQKHFNDPLVPPATALAPLLRLPTHSGENLAGRSPSPSPGPGAQRSSSSKDASSTTASAPGSPSLSAGIRPFMALKVRPEAAAARDVQVLYKQGSAAAATAYLLFAAAEPLSQAPGAWTGGL